MKSSRLGLAHAPVALFLMIAALPLGGCLSHERSDGDAGGDGSVSDSCGGGPACAPGNHCLCDRCLSLDLAPSECDPPCATAQHGDLCTEEGRVCPLGSCSELVCTRGSFVGRAAGDVCDAGVGPDVGVDSGWCECPAPPPGCVYDGSPCGCSHLTCPPPERCGREVCASGTTCCNASCGICVSPGDSCIDLACAPDCAPSDARSNGRCAGSPGWAWDGEACRAIACRCEGTECDAIYPTFDACNAYFSACAPVDCTPDDATGVGACAAVLGYAFTTRGCFAISGCSCTGADCEAVASQTEAECNEAHASCPILFI